MKVLKNSLLVFLISLLTTSAFASMELIKEVDALRNSIGLADRQRPRLTLRLADLHFDLAQDTAQTEAEKGTLEISNKVKKIFIKSKNFYSDAISGENGTFKVPSINKLFKIKFQLARIYFKLNDRKSATTYFEEVVAMPINSVNIKRESVLNLAEIYEDNNIFEKANVNYAKALELCNKKELCSYIQYRRSWLFFKKGDIDKAISTIKLGLFDSNENLKEQSLQDYLMFIVQKPTDGKSELVEMESFSQKHNRPEILEVLMNGYFGEGNRVAGVTFLTYLNRKTPNTLYQVRLMEEHYGFRNWDKFKQITAQASDNSTKLVADSKNTKKVEKILRRLIVQLDSERKSNIVRIEDLQNTIDMYLRMFPNDDLRDKMVNGWIAVEKNEERLLQKLGDWIEQENKLARKVREKELRIKRISLAQKLKNNIIVLSEAKAVIPLLNKDEVREYKYLVARTQYTEKDLDNALSGFREIAKLSENSTSKSLDKFALQSQNLALDILNLKKDFVGIKELSSAWLSHSAFKNHKEYKNMSKIHEQAKFQNAFVQKDNPNSLSVFTEYCLNDQFKDKSCTNAKILALKLKNQETLIKILKKQNDINSLIVEYEAMGEFSKAAFLLEKQQKKFNLNFFLKVSLFYEIEKDIKQRDRILRKIVKNLKKAKPMEPAMENLVYQTLNDADMIDHKILTLPWSITRKMNIVHELELRGKGTRKTRKLLFSSKKTLGDKWSLGKLASIHSNYEEQKKLSFYGRRSQRKFKKRIKSLKSFANKSKIVLEGSDLKTRVIILNLIAKAYKELSDEIVNTPLPSGLDEEQLKEVNSSLADMAAPFRTEFENIKATSLEQLNSIENVELKTKLSTNYADYKSFYNELPIYGKNINKLDVTEIQTSFNNLKLKPNELNTLTKIKQFFEKGDQSRIANYFKGRILSL